MSNINWDDLGSNSLADLKRECHNRNLETPKRPTKPQLIQLLTNSVKPTFISNKFNVSSDYSQHESQKTSQRESPSPQMSFKSPSNKRSVTSANKKETFLNEKIISTTSDSQQSRTNENREQSPLLPSSSSKKNKQTGSHKKSSHATEERKVRYNNVDRSQRKRNSISHHEVFIVPKKFLIMNYLSASLAIVFTVLSVFCPMLLIFAIVNAIIFYFAHVKLNSILDKKSHALATKVTSYLENECNGSALKSHLMDKFNADTYVMRRLSSFLISKGRIEVENQADGDKVWTIRNN